jgi:hypothetical protein
MTAVQHIDAVPGMEWDIRSEIPAQGAPELRHASLTNFAHHHVGGHHPTADRASFGG